MSSLAGALDDSKSSLSPLKREDYSSRYHAQDIDMYSPTLTMVKQDGIPLKHEQAIKQEDLKTKVQEEDAEMDDLFGNDEDVEEAQPSACVVRIQRCRYVSHIISRTVASPSASAPDSDRLPSAERDRRQALEYEEEEIPPDFAIEVKEAEVSFPNLPVPKSSDGDVRKDSLNRWK